MQKEDFIGIYEAMEGKAVTIRFLDPPLHEFLPTADEDIEALVCFKDPYPNETTATIKDNTITINGIEQDELKDSKITITSGSGRNTVTVVDGDDLTGLTYTSSNALEKGTEYNISITLNDYQPLTFTTMAE